MKTDARAGGHTHAPRAPRAHAPAPRAPPPPRALTPTPARAPTRVFARAPGRPAKQSMRQLQTATEGWKTRSTKLWEAAA